MDAKHAQGEPRLLISRDALIHNAAVIRARLAPDTRICAVVKANAYGHDVDLVIDALYNFSTDDREGPFVDSLGVNTIDEAEALPATHLQTFIFRPVENGLLTDQRARIESAIHNNWVLTLCSASAADDVARIAVAMGRRACVQVMIDTGLARVGIDIADLPRLLNTIAGHASLKLTAFGTHFADADRPDSPVTAAQIERFRAATDEPMAKLNATVSRSRVLRHAANSPGVFFHPESHFDMVRPGMSLYGIDPTFTPSLDRPLRPALKWVAPLTGIRSIKKGDSVGYGHTWTAPRDTRIGVVPIGYADGYLRAFSNKAVMLLDDKPVPVIGNVCMDSTTLDLGPDSQATSGDPVTILDDNPLSPASAYALARLANTIPEELLCLINPRLKRLPREVETDDMARKEPS